MVDTMQREGPSIKRGRLGESACLTSAVLRQWPLVGAGWFPSWDDDFALMSALAGVRGRWLSVWHSLGPRPFAPMHDA